MSNTIDSPLVEYAHAELQRAGMFDADADYGGALGHAVLEVVKVFARQEHSGMSAALSISLLGRLLQFRPLSPISGNPDEWQDVSEASGEPMWQNRRDGTAFSKNGGKSWYLLDELKVDQGDGFVSYRHPEPGDFHTDGERS